MKIVNTENSEHYRWGNDSDGWHLLEFGSLSVIEENLSPYQNEKRHYHNEAQQFFYVLAGVAHLEISGEVFELRAGSGIHIPAKQPHQVANNGATDLRILVISQPKSHGDRVNV